MSAFQQHLIGTLYKPWISIRNAIRADGLRVTVSLQWYGAPLGASHHLRYGICVVARNQAPTRSGKIIGQHGSILKLISVMTRTHTSLMRGVRLALMAVTALAILQLLCSSIYGSRSYGRYPYYRAVRISNMYSRLGSQPKTATGHSRLRPGRGPDPTTGGEANCRSCSTRQR